MQQDFQHDWQVVSDGEKYVFMDVTDSESYIICDIKDYVTVRQ